MGNMGYSGMMGTGYGATRDMVLRGLFAGIQCRNVRIQHEDGEWRSSVRQGEAATARCLGAASHGLLQSK